MELFNPQWICTKPSGFVFIRPETRLFSVKILLVVAVLPGGLRLGVSGPAARNSARPHRPLRLNLLQVKAMLIYSGTWTLKRFFL